MAQLKSFIEYKKTYFGETKVFKCALASYNASVGELVVAYRPEESMRFVGIDFPVGSVSYGYYWNARNYNVYHWKSDSGKTLLFYFNISRDTRIQKSAVTWTDLIVDVALIPGGSPRVLDEDEIPANISKDDLRTISETKREILNNLDEIVWELESKTERVVSG